MGEDARLPVIARLATRWGRSNSVILVTLKKGNHPGEAYVKSGQKKLYTEEREGLLRGAPRGSRDTA